MPGLTVLGSTSHPHILFLGFFRAPPILQYTDHVGRMVPSQLLLHTSCHRLQAKTKNTNHVQHQHQCLHHMHSYKLRFVHLTKKDHLYKC